MNYYRHHIGDYASATEHLNWDEDMAYTRLMRVYYRDEKPLPAEHAKVYRLVRAQTKAERTAVDAVLAEFFLKDEAGYRNKRCDEEISTDRAFIEKQSANGRASAAKRRFNGGSTTAPTVVQPKLNGGATVGQPPTPTPTPNLNPKSGQAAISDSPPDPRTQLFEIGKSLLGANAGGLISKAIKASDEATVGAILGEMALKPTADPRAYFVAAARSKGESERFKTA